MSSEPGFEEETMRTAALWWTILRDPQPSADSLERWENWMSADPSNALAFAQLNELGEAAANAPAEQRRQLIDEFAPRTVLPHRRLLAAAAAVVGFVLLGGWLALHESIHPGGQLEQYASAIGENQNIRLSDGTAIELGAASKLTTRYARDRRDVDLNSGEAFFTVTHDGSRPFVVAAGPLHIEDLGTAFNVRRTGDRVSVAVTEGRVRLSPADGSSHGREEAMMGRLDLVAGQRAEYDPQTGAVSVSQVAIEHAAAWRQNRLEFVNEPLSNVIANVNRYTRQPVQFADPKLGELMFTGNVNTTTIDGWVNALPHVFPVQVSTFADHVVLSGTAQH